MSKLRDKNIVIFGGSTGIGKAMTILCAKEGAHVIIASRNQENLDQTKHEIKNEYDLDIVTIACDVTNDDDVKKVYQYGESLQGGVYGVVCSSGVYGPIGPLEQNDFESWKKCIEINLTGTARCIYLIIESMKKRKKGKIVLMSGGGQAALPHFSAYTASKGGIWRLTETLGAELSPYGIYLNTIAPGAVNTKMLSDLLEAGKESVGKEFYEKSIEQKESGGTSPLKAAQCALYLLSNKSDHLYGKIISAVWDNYANFEDLDSLSKSDLYTMKRIIKEDGGTRFK